MKNKRFITLICMSFLLLILAACSGEGKPGENAAKEEVLPEDIVELRADQVKLAGIQTGSVEVRSMSRTLKVNGIVTVSPGNLATVCMPVGGFVHSTSLIPGSPVTKGQTLAVIESQEFVDIQQQYLESKSQLEYSEAEFRRHSELYKDDVYSQKNLQQVTADYKSLKARVKALGQKLMLIGLDPQNLHEDDISGAVPVVSPISGSVQTVNVNLGKHVSPSDILFEIINRDHMLLELTLFEKDADKVAAGRKIRFFINNETEMHEAVITQTGKSVSSDKTYKVYADVTSACRNILPGMYVNAVIESAGSQVPAVPSEAVVSFDDKDYIFVVSRDKEENGRPFTEYRMVNVRKGVSDGGYTEILLPEGFDMKTAKVVVRGAYNLLSAKKNAGEMAC